MPGQIRSDGAKPAEPAFDRPHGNPLCLRNSPHCPAVASKHRCTFGSILLQYFASEVCRVLSHTCELVWNALSNWISVCLGICRWSFPPSSLRFIAYSAYNFWRDAYLKGLAHCLVIGRTHMADARADQTRWRKAGLPCIRSNQRA